MPAEEIRLRPAQPEDAASVAAIWNPIIRDTAITFWPTERSEPEIAGIIRDRLASGRAFLLAVSDDRVLGFATYDQFRGGLGYARSMEHSINLAPAARGRGIGRLLLRAVEEHATGRGHRLMIGAITATNQGSIAFHRAMGYAEWGRIPAAGWKFETYHDLVLMGRDLRS
ncbi:GNAT family N-acetyltransferase [Paracoccus sp. 1_MG-2023]|uniref:GNAT family N-acetyltransferase n=1 Tax=unclassified Paracoccus (in: a-proteobacteria) TaxID=2688777 RepID=UPI001C082DDE|nr:MULTISPECIES: GNAT family N-acetyltransferase [unclassified Paracoccus (in: a-proteobacteria)]MBU2958660.1 GNAT family N-acetyltransferase [Paracoccus sp. C2R09]MDO6667653.1 GNAT family N-acetyltransferase [Paracoccus sp. 1_MG-2023]